MNQTEKIPFSVAMSVYKNDSPEQLEVALESICTQSLPADEIYLVIDGPVGQELHAVIQKFSDRYGNFTINQLEKNGGLGNALRIAVEKCRNDLIFRMDSDDISAPGRFKKQIDAYLQEPADVLGGWTLGFVGNLETGKVSSAKRKLTSEEIVKQIGIKSPMSHVTVLFRRSAVLKAGNYQDLFYHEDYYLWARMIEAGCTFRNIPEYLVYVRLGEDQAKRHGGRRYFKAEHTLRKYMLEHRLCSRPCYMKQMAIRVVYQLLIPANLRNYLAMKYKRVYLKPQEVHEILNRNISDVAGF